MKDKEKQDFNLSLEKFKMAKEDTHTRCYILLQKLSRSNRLSEISKGTSEKYKKKVEKLKEWVKK